MLDSNIRRVERELVDGSITFRGNRKATPLGALLPTYVRTQLFQYLLETVASEHGSRMTAMESATRNANEVIDALTLRYNKARQAAITREIIEIVSGAEALSG